ncbi:MAG: hypothetical protein LBP69_05025 [Treponema sp.]|jgi:hypothetical protein|nr:hypothetical protein [Treponema sp.]
MKKAIFVAVMFSMVLILGLVLAGCGDSEGGPTGNGGEQTGGNSGEQTGGNGAGDGKVTITLLAGSGTGNIRLKLSSGTWDTDGSWNAAQSSSLKGIIGSLLTIYGGGTSDACTATIIENNTALNIEVKSSSGLLVASGEAYVNTTLNPVTFPYTSHEGVSLSEKFQVAGGPVSFVNKTRLYASGSDLWASGSNKIAISESQIQFVDSSYTYTYNIDTWKAERVSGDYCVTIDVSNGRTVHGNAWTVPSCITGKTSFTFRVDSSKDSLSIRQVNGETFSGTNGWDNSFTK